MKNLPVHIGSKELVTFPEVGSIDVPAKTDTGADSSAVWATDIRERPDGGLSFKLFGPGSKFYSGRVLCVDKFKITQVTNSFGHKEQRYKVKLSVVIGGHLTTTQFTLADRSRNRYPVLIGRKTLNKRFIVDVSKDNTRSNDMPRRVLILNTTSSDRVRMLVSEINRNTHGLEVDSTTYDDLVLILGGNEDMEIIRNSVNSSLSGYDLIYFKSFFKSAEMAAAVAEYALLRGIKFIDSEVATHHAYTKVSEYARLSRFGLPLPKSLIMSYTHIAASYTYFKKVLGLPFVLKDASANKGKSNFLIRNETDFKFAAEKAILEHSYYIGQRYIENDGDYRVIVFDKEVKLVIERQRLDDTTHLNNTSRGARARLIESYDLPSKVAALAVRAALVMGREVAGVDLMQDKENGKWIILEVNSTPELASGVFVDKKVSELGKFLLEFAQK